MDSEPFRKCNCNARGRNEDRARVKSFDAGCLAEVEKSHPGIMHYSNHDSEVRFGKDLDCAQFLDFAHLAEQRLGASQRKLGSE